MDMAEIGMATNELEGYAMVGQGLDFAVDDTRRLRLLAFVDASFHSPYTDRHGKRYRSPAATRSGSPTTSRACRLARRTRTSRATSR